MRMADLIRKNITQAKEEEDEQKRRLPHGSKSSNKEEEQLSFRFPGPPGLVEGVATGLVVLGVLTPVRSMLVKRFLSPAVTRGASSSSNACQQQRQDNSSLGLLPEFLLTSTQMLLSAHAALYMGSLFGSHHYLHQLAAINPAAVSRTADAICHDALVTRLLKQRQAQEKRIPTMSSPPSALPNVNVVSSSSSSSAITMMMMNPDLRILLELQKALDTCRARNSLQQQQQ